MGLGGIFSQLLLPSSMKSPFPCFLRLRHSPPQSALSFFISLVPGFEGGVDRHYPCSTGSVLSVLKGMVVAG